MDTSRIISNLRLAIELAGDGGCDPFLEEDRKEMYEFLDKIEKQQIVKTHDDWKGCQGTCDFDPIPNTTGWI